VTSVAVDLEVVERPEAGLFDLDEVTIPEHSTAAVVILHEPARAKDFGRGDYWKIIEVLGHVWNSSTRGIAQRR
jgi:hypothetical protein